MLGGPFGCLCKASLSLVLKHVSVASMPQWCCLGVAAPFGVAGLAGYCFFAHSLFAKCRNLQQSAVAFLDCCCFLLHFALFFGC
ncbi:hypothetical protein U1Q18_042973 [Sarracenia purpurea var. burkii]